MSSSGRHSNLELAYPIELNWQVNRLQSELIPSSWHYRLVDPYAVTVEFEPDTTNKKVWTFGRDLVRDALAARKLGTIGIGDVRFSVQTPSARPQKPQLQMQLARPNGSLCRLAAQREALEDFLFQSQILVPFGTESSIVLAELDRELDFGAPKLSDPE